MSQIGPWQPDLPPVEVRTVQKESLLRRWGFMAALALAPFLLGAASSDASKDNSVEGNSNSGAESTALVDQSDASESEASDPALRTITKLIPDQKVYVGSPETILDLGAVFSQTAIAADGPLELEVKRNKKEKVVLAKFEGDQLRLTWGKLGKSEITIRATNAKTGQFIDNRFKVEVWEADYWMLAMIVVGGLGIFLLGMKNMSEGLQAVAGSSLRRMISIATNNRLLATGVGVMVTMLVQSSSITTVMVVGFVNSGFMTLTQAIGVVMGANVGTTITGWILVLKIGKYGLPILGVAAITYLFSRRDRVRYLAMAAMGLGMIFLGLELMKNGFAIIKDLPDFEAWFATFQADTYLGVLKCAAVGCILTFLVQSSSATLGITIGLASIGVIPFDTAAALVMGENVGTTITAWLASFGATTNAKRAAYFHVVFNLVGVAWITAIFIPFYLPMVKVIVGVSAETGQVTDVTAAIATTHTLFNVTNTLIFLPFSSVFANALCRLVPEKKHKEKPHLTNLDVRMLETPVIAIEQSRVEILRMADGCNKMMSWLKTALESEDPDPKLVQKLFHREEVLDSIQDEVVHFMTNLLSANLPHTVIDEGRRQLRMADEYESISDYITSILKFQLKLRNQGQRLDEGRREELLTLNNKISDYLHLVTEAYQMRNPEVLTKAHSLGSEVTSQVKKLREKHLQDLIEHPVEPHANVAYTATLNSYRRVGDHTLNIAEALAGVK